MSPKRHPLATPYMVLVILIGAVVVVRTIWVLPVSHLGLPFLLLAAATIGIDSRLTIKVPGFGSEISMSEIFVFLTMFQFDGEAAVLLATMDGLVTSLRISKKNLTRVFNASALACSIALTVWILRLGFGPISQLHLGDVSLKMICGVFTMALVAHSANSALVALGESLSAGGAFWGNWRRYAWACIPYLAAACSGLVISRLIDVIGIYGLLLTMPIVLLLYLAYRTHVRNLEAASSQARQAESHLAELRESEERFRRVFDHAAIGMALVSPGGRWLKVNSALCEMLGYMESELLCSNLREQLRSEDRDAVFARVRAIAEGTLSKTLLESRYIHKSGHELWTLLSITQIRDPESHQVQLSFQIQNITQQKKALQQILHDAIHDSVTGLPNRALFGDRLQLAMDRLRRAKGKTFSVIVLSLDNYKSISDSLGHAVADQLLISVARRLEEIMRPGDTVARLESDEFTLLIEDIGDPRDAVSIAERVSRALAKPFELDGHEIFTTVTTGIAAGSLSYEHPADILRDANAALSRAQGQGRARCEIFDRGMHAKAMTLIKRESCLRKAVERNEFFLQYHPILSLRSSSVEGFEALVRWRHPEEGIIPPLEFIPLAEKCELIQAIGAWVLREACRQVSEWRRELRSFPSLTMSVNLSGKQWVQPDIVDQILRILKETGCEREALKVEITETILMDNMEPVTAALQRLRDLKIESSIDDFGTGYSSLGYLHRLPASTLKIDKSFVLGMSQNRESLEIVRTIIMLARNLCMSVVAEGIETAEQLKQLRGLQCDLGQGYLFAKPLDAAAATDLLLKAESRQLAYDHDLAASAAGPADAPRS